MHDRTRVFAMTLLAFITLITLGFLGAKAFGHAACKPADGAGEHLLVTDPRSAGRGLVLDRSRPDPVVCQGREIRCALSRTIPAAARSRGARRTTTLAEHRGRRTGPGDPAGPVSAQRVSRHTAHVRHRRPRPRGCTNRFRRRIRPANRDRAAQVLRIAVCTFGGHRRPGAVGGAGASHRRRRSGPRRTSSRHRAALRSLSASQRHTRTHRARRPNGNILRMADTPDERARNAVRSGTRDGVAAPDEYQHLARHDFRDTRDGAETGEIDRCPISDERRTPAMPLDMGSSSGTRFSSLSASSYSTYIDSADIFSRSLVTSSTRSRTVRRPGWVMSSMAPATASISGNPKASAAVEM